MSDPAESSSLFLLPEDDNVSLTAPVERDPTGAPLRSYIDELRARVDALPDDYPALMVPPDALPPARWVATDIETALHAAAEVVPRSPSSPDSVLPPSMAPLAESSLRNVRRPNDAVAGRAAAEFAPIRLPTLPSHEGSGQTQPTIAPAGSRAVSTDMHGPIAAALMNLINQERSEAAPPRAPGPAVDQTPTLPEAHEAPPASVASVEDAPLLTVAPEVVTENVDATQGSVVTVALRALLLFVTAWIAGGTTVYFLLRG